MLKNSGNFEIRRVDVVGPKVGNELRIKGLSALFISMLVILIYVSFRFEYKFAFGAIIALIHDIAIAIGALSLFKVEINLDILAALLTIIGYSLNDTIIVYDRIREGIRKLSSKDINIVINTSVSRTLSRTTLTSLTTFFVVLTLYLFGGEIIHGFALILLVGIVVGTYSSIFIASSFLVFFKFSMSNFRDKEYKAKQRADEKARIRAQYEQGTI
jgi:preprotein translocase subunit SecF